jgi:aarF domain-containing kinase
MMHNKLLTDIVQILRGVALVASSAKSSKIASILPWDSSPSIRAAVIAQYKPKEHAYQSINDFTQPQSPKTPVTLPPSHSQKSTTTASPTIQPRQKLNAPPPPASTTQQPQQRRERRVPATPLGRAMGFAGLGMSLIGGTVVDKIADTFSLSSSSSSSSSKAIGAGNAFVTEKNAERLAATLCRMRGAALKLGQMISIQDENVIPPQLQIALERVRAGADIMPKHQLDTVLKSELGSDWRSKVKEFDHIPLGSASIGQVHKAVLHDGRQAVMKIQYPGVAKSISSDVDNLLRLIRLSNLLPKGMFIENAAKVAKKELAMECDYTLEAVAQQRFKKLVASDAWAASHVTVPEVFPELSTDKILTSEFVPGVSIDNLVDMPQEVRDAVGSRLLKLTLKELFEWKFMQTDPNFANFLYFNETDMLHLIDFGAARDFPPDFVSNYLEMVKGCAEHNREEIISRSVTLGFLTGEESKIMLDAHVEAGIVVGLPFSTEGVYDFGQSSDGTLTKRVTELGQIMLRHRLTPPPEDSYSLHRKLSGAFLTCIKLKARVPAKELFYEVYEAHARAASEEEAEMVA